MPVNVQVNPLDSLIQGFQTGMQLTPAAIQNRNLSNQLALQLQQVQLQRAQQQLNDYLHPENAISRQIQGQLAVQSLNPLSGIVAAPSGLSSETIGVPRAVGVTESDLLNQEASRLPFQIPTAAPATPITPIIGVGGQPTGFSRDLNSALEGALQERQLQNITNPPQAKAYTPGSYVATPEQLAAGTGFTVPERGVAPKNTVLSKGQKLLGPDNKVIFENPDDAPRPTIIPPGGVILDSNNQVIFKNDKADAAAKPLSTQERSALFSLAGSKSFLTDALGDYDKLNNFEFSLNPITAFGGKVGPIAGRFQSAKAALGFGDKDFKAFNARLKSNLFQSARALQGAGVLTEKDITRMEEISPTGNEERDAFIGGIEGMRQVMLDRANAFRDLNASRMNQDELAAINQIITKLSSSVEGGTEQQPISPTAPKKIGRFELIQ